MSDADRPADEGRAKLAGRLLVLLAAVMWSTSGFFAHAPVFEDWPREMRGPLPRVEAIAVPRPWLVTRPTAESRYPFGG